MATGTFWGFGYTHLFMPTREMRCISTFTGSHVFGMH